MDTMTPRERILATINRQPVDRRPVDIWCTPEILDELRRYTSTEDEMEVYRKLGVDKIVWVFPGYNGRYFDPNDSGEITMWGVPTRMVKAGLATYQEYIDPPIGEYVEPSELETYPSWPDPDLFDYEGSKALARKARSYDFATIGPWISHFEIYCQMRGLENAFELLGSGGRLAVITFHSLEDRIVKQQMAAWCQGCTCPKDFPVCVCRNTPKAKLVNKKPICANETELTENPRARSAKLRICEKI